MADSDDVNTLKRRGRRRLVGAIALVLAAVIVLPMVFDSEPRRSAPPVSVRIPAEDEGGFAPKAAQKVPATPAVEAIARAPEKAPDTRAERGAATSAPRPAEPAPKKPPAEAAAEKQAPPADAAAKQAAAKAAPGKVAAAPAAAPAAAAESAKPAPVAAAERFMVPAGAYADPSAVIEKLKSARIPYYTEPIATKQGTVTRVRAGPFAGREAAEKVLRQLRDLGLKPGNVAAVS